MSIYKDSYDAGARSKFKSMLEPSGFPIDQTTGDIDRSSSVISWDEPTRTLSINPTGDIFEFYVDSKRFTSTGESIQIDDTEGLWFFYFDSDGVIQKTQIFELRIIYSLAFIAFLYWDATGKTAIPAGPFDERHGAKLDGHAHGWMHEKFGTRHESGGELNTINSAGSGAVNADAQFGIDASVIYDEDIKFGLNSVLSTSGLPILYLLGTEASPILRVLTNPGFSITTAGTGRMAFNELTGGNWQISEVSNNQYALCHVFATSGIGVDGEYYAVMGQGDYTTQNQARLGASTEIKTLLSVLPVQEKDWIGTVIFQTGAYGNDVNSRIRPTDLGADWTDWRFWDYKDFIKDSN